MHETEASHFLPGLAAAGDDPAGDQFDLLGETMVSQTRRGVEILRQFCSDNCPVKIAAAAADALIF